MDQKHEAVAIMKAALPGPIEPLTLRSTVSPELIDPSRFVGGSETTEDGNLSLSLGVLSCLVPESESFDLVGKVRPALNGIGYQAMQTTHGFKDFCHIFGTGVVPATEQYGGQALLVFFPAPDAASLIYVRQTNGANYDLMPRDIVDRLDSWKQLCDFSVLGAGFDWMELVFYTLPKDLREFAKEVYEFCPDTLDQGIVKAPPAQLQSIKEPSEEDMEAMLEWMDESLEQQTPDDLAESLEREKRLWLWWD